MVDLLLAFTANGKHHRLAIELKVDSPPKHSQIVAMRGSLGQGAERRLVLLALGTAQASRIEPDGAARFDDVPRWLVPEMLGLGELLIATSVTVLTFGAEAGTRAAFVKQLRALHAAWFGLRLCK